MEPDNDHRIRRCPRLGGPVSFGYCRGIGENGLPCGKVFDCWWERFDIVAYVQSCLSEDQYERLVRVRPQPKLCSLVELIAQAKRRNRGASG